MPVRLELDHIVIAAETLAEGVTFVEDKLRVKMAPGGRHAVMGTHNRLLSLGEIYLEVIAVDPDAPAPSHARWFGLDTFRGPPRVTNWVARTDDLAAALALAPPGAGTPIDVTRGDLSWTMAVPADGQTPFGGAFPALIQWRGTAHPAVRLPDLQLRLAAFQVSAEDPLALRDALARYECGLDALAVNWSGAPFGLAISTLTGLVKLQ